MSIILISRSMKHFFKITFVVVLISSLSCKKELVPNLTTSEITEIRVNSAKCGGTIINEGSSTVISRGVCWSTETTPTISNKKTIDGAGAGDFTSNMTDLNGGTVYYVRAYATNNSGTGYGSVMSFTSEIPVTDLDGNIYQTITIGNQTWMKENLKTTKLNDGTQIPLVSNNTDWTNLITPGYCWYNNDESSNKNLYGGLYNGYAVLTSKLCPIGWHIPSDTEWKTLETYLGMSELEAGISGYRGINQGGKLKEAGVAHWDQPNTDATNETGFAALPSGWRSTGPFFGIRTLGFYWSSTLYSSSIAYRLMSNQTGKINRSTYGDKEYGFAVRCIKD